MAIEMGDERRIRKAEKGNQKRNAKRKSCDNGHE